MANALRCTLPQIPGQIHFLSFDQSIFFIRVYRVTKRYAAAHQLLRQTQFNFAQFSFAK